MTAADHNDPLEQAWAQALREAEGVPEFLEQLLHAVVFSMGPYRPELIGTGVTHRNEVIPCQQRLNFRLMGQKHDPAIPLYTSLARADIGLKRSKMPPHWGTLIGMKGECMLRTMTHYPALDILVNPGCPDGSLRFHQNPAAFADDCVCAGCDAGERRPGVDPAD